MFADYQKQVLLTYHKKKAENQLSLNLTHATPAKLKRECMAVFSERYQHHQDEKILRMFFGPRDNAGAYMQAISTVDADKFRPLLAFLRENIVATDEKNIELLAWLIDFQPRPFQWNYDYQKEPTIDKTETEVKEGNNPVLEEEELKEGEELNEAAFTEGAEQPGENKEEVNATTTADSEVNTGANGLASLFRRRKVLILISMLAICGGGIYIGKIKVEPGITGPEKCMFWTGDHYQPVSCNQKMDGVTVYALDTLKTKRFKKIIKTDTLSNNSLGHVWYSKIDGAVEFYTADGFHPVHTERRLKPMTPLILNKYARGNTVLRAGNN